MSDSWWYPVTRRGIGRFVCHGQMATPLCWVFSSKPGELWARDEEEGGAADAQAIRDGDRDRADAYALSH